MSVTEPSLSEGLPGPSEAEITARFDDLQRKLVPLWRSIQSFNQDPQTIVVVPSLGTTKGVKQDAYEERFLFLLLLLRQPNARVIYVTSQAVPPGIVDYYLGLLPGVIGSHARRRLFLVSPLDGSARTLTQKLLDRPRLLRHIRSLILDPNRAHLVPYSTTTAERDLALQLGIPMYGADPRYFHLGTKSGSRRIFAEEGVSHPIGVEDLTTEDQLVDAIVRLRAEKPAMPQVVVKLNEGVSGGGNATVDLTGVPAPGSAIERAAVLARVRAMRFELATLAYETYMARLGKHAGIVEERIVGTDLQSPSAQLRVTPLGDVEALSTHDQLLGGPSGQMYLGCTFPASPDYAPAIMREAMKVGRRLAKEGVIGRFALDFVTVRNARGEWEAYAIEINLRKGGTTHPFLTLQFLTDGKYDAERGVFTTPRGEAKHFVASDHLHSPAYKALTHDDLFDLAARHGVHFDQTHQTGVVFHMMNAIGEEGLLGLTAVANSAAEAQALYERTVHAIDTEAERALDPSGN
jgi:hypothetical protein